MKRGPKPKPDRSTVRTAIAPVQFRCSMVERVRLDRVLAAREAEGRGVTLAEFFREWIVKEAERLEVPE